MTVVLLHRVRFDLGAGCWIDIESARGEGGSFPEEPEIPGLLVAQQECGGKEVLSGGIPPMCWREAGELFEKFQLREDTDYFVDVAVPCSLNEALKRSGTNPAWPFAERLASAFIPEPSRRWRVENGRTVITGQLRLRSHAGVLDLRTEYGGQLLAEVACRKLNYFEEFKELLDGLADKAAELLLSFDSPVTLSFSTSNDLAKNEAALHFLMRHVMARDQLPSAVEEILAAPHGRLLESVELCPIEEVVEVDAELVADGLDYADLHRGGPLSRLFGGHTPTTLPHRQRVESRDTPENRYAKAFLEHCSLLARKLEVSFERRKRRASEREARAWAVQLDELLQHGMWKEVGPLTQIPSNSQALQRKRGYKNLFRYDMSLRMALALQWDASDGLADGLSGDARPVNQIYEYWCFFTLRDVLRSVCTEVKGGNFLKVAADGLRVELQRGRSSECKFEYVDAEGTKALVSLFYNRRFRRPQTPTTSWEGSYTSSFDPDFSVRVTAAAHGSSVHWLHFDAKYRLQREQADVLFEEASNEVDTYESEVNRVHKQEDLYKMHTYRDGILGSRGAYVLFPGDGAGGQVTQPGANLFVRHPSAFGVAVSHSLPSVGTFPLAPQGGARQLEAIRHLLVHALVAAVSPGKYAEEEGRFAPLS